MLAMIREHNTLNGLRFVLVEFLVVTLAALWIGVGTGLHRQVGMALAGCGIAANGLAALIIAAAQLHAHDANIGLLKAWSAKHRARIARDFPDLTRHTTLIVVFLLVPFLLVLLLSMERRMGGGRR